MKNKWKALFLSCLCVFSRMAIAQEEVQKITEEPGMVIDSAVADYDGRKITLSGTVVVEHDLGKISADFVELVPSHGKKLRFEFLTMKENIQIALKDGGKLSCSYAFLDYCALTGLFKGDAQQEYVIYTEGYRDKENMIIPLVVKSRQMNVLIDLQEDKLKSPKSRISAIEASDNVTVNYNHEFIALADQASYQRMSPELSSSAEAGNAQLPGLIFLRAAEQNGLCQVTNRNSDLIRANHICIDTVKRHLLFSNPKGSISTGRDAAQTERIDFSSGIMTWEALNDILTLQEHVVMSQPGVGRLTTEKEVRFFRHMVAGTKQLRSIESSGPVILTIADEKKGIEHTLTAHGKLIVNHQNLKTVMDSPRDDSGHVLPNKQVCFQDNMGRIYADRLRIDYQITDNDITPVKMTLEGNVQILNRGAIGQDANEAFRQYALADTVEYSPQAKEVSLMANHGKRVLFLDKINGLEVSAPALKLRRDQTTKKESIQGVGDVRFNFIETELQQMKTFFPGTGS